MYTRDRRMDSDYITDIEKAMEKVSYCCGSTVLHMGFQGKTMQPCNSPAAQHQQHLLWLVPSLLPRGSGCRPELRPGKWFQKQGAQGMGSKAAIDRVTMMGSHCHRRAGSASLCGAASPCMPCMRARPWWAVLTLPLQAASPASHCRAMLVQVGLRWSDMRLVDNTCKPHPNPNIQDRILGGLQDLDPEQTNPDPSPFEPMTNAKI